MTLHWYCQTCEPAVVDAVSRLNTEVSQESIYDSTIMFEKVEDGFTRSIETVTSNLSKALNVTISHITQVIKIYHQK